MAELRAGVELGEVIAGVSRGTTLADRLSATYRTTLAATRLAKLEAAAAASKKATYAKMATRIQSAFRGARMRTGPLTRGAQAAGREAGAGTELTQHMSNINRTALSAEDANFFANMHTDLANMGVQSS